MNNFGVIEIATTKTTTAPGWAYVPDNPHPRPNLTTTTRKRPRNTTTTTTTLSAVNLADSNARQEAKTRRELDRDNDVVIPIPIPIPAATRVSKKANVRKILQSQKNFGNHLDDFLAVLDGGEGGIIRRGGGLALHSHSQPQTQTQPPSTTKIKAMEEEEDVQMPDMPDAENEAENENENDKNPLLTSRIPPQPTEEEIRGLLSAPPLTYLEARGKWESNNNNNSKRYPTREFCSICGYWGRTRCIKCGTRVCALECLETHREDCITRYGL
ncbi:hypothetical protein GGS20DRAFT_123625 [Poronia punctata]|nr:hypothetical protein GGS20DRAFT_123625 [Poronia punctata]